MEKPSYISVQGHPIKVQQWQIREQDIVVTTIATADRSAADILNLVSKGTVPIGWEGMDAHEAAVSLSDHRVTGDGAKAVHRITFAMAADAFPRLQPQVTLEDRLASVLDELDRLRKQVAELQHRVEYLEGQEA